MYFAINQDIQNIEAYCSFLNEVMNSGNPYYTKLFKDIIQQTQKLINTNDYYSVSSERFAIVKHFAQYPEVVNSIDINNLQMQDFEKLISCFENHLSPAL